MPTYLTSNVAKKWLNLSLSELEQQKDYLSTLDDYVGDGDHGHNVIRGFEKIKASWPEDVISLESIFHYAGSVLKEETDSSGVQLYGEAFLEMSKVTKGNEVTLNQLGTVLQAAVSRMKKAGDTKRGDKTLIDVWAAVADAAEKQTDPHINIFEDSAKSALKSSKHLMAQKGQAAEYGNRSVGFLDPGVVSSYYVFSALSDVLQEAEQRFSSG
jgi:dihydroxyacetone kinase-like protein